MRKVSINFLKPGMIVARSVYDSGGRLLLAAGITLTENFIKRLSEMGIGSLYVEDEVFVGDVHADDIVSKRTRIKSVKLLKETYHHVENQGYIDTRTVQKAIDELIDEILGSYGTLINYYEIRTYDDYTFSHSVDVCIFSLLTGISLGFDRLKLKELGIGALLHDIGKVKVSKEVLNKPGALTPDELQQIRRHPEEGFNILRRHHDIPLLSAHIALQHQERLDGSGYPRRLSGDEIHKYARVVMIADVFDALTSDRPYRTAYPVMQAVDFIGSLAGEAFEEDYVAALFSNISPFPAGSVVMLNTGEIGQVVKTDKSAPDRPVVRIFFDRQQNRINHPFEIDLSGEPSLSIVHALSEEDISRLPSGSIQSGGSACLGCKRRELPCSQGVPADRALEQSGLKKPGTSG